MAQKRHHSNIGGVHYSLGPLPRGVAGTMGEAADVDLAGPEVAIYYVETSNDSGKDPVEEVLEVQDEAVIGLAKIEGIRAL